MNNNQFISKEIGEELVSISRVASEKMPAKRAFDIPDGYFEKLEEDVFSQLIIARHLPVQRKYDIPDGYFFEKEESAIVKAVDKNNPGVRKIIAWVSTVAAMIIIGLFAVSPQQQKDSIDNEEMAWVYLSENVDSWD